MTTIFSRMTTSLQWAAVGCALFAAVGTALGYHAAAGGWVMPIFGGLVLALSLGVGWHAMIGAASKTRTALGTTALVLGGFFLMSIAVGSSAQAVVTALAGTASISAELTERVTPIAEALDEAKAQADVGPLVGSALATAAGYGAMAGQEASGDLGSGSGCGPRCAQMTSFQSSFQRAGEALAAMNEEGKAIAAAGADALVDLRQAAAAGDQTAFLLHAERVATAVSDLRAIDPTTIVQTTGVVTVKGDENLGLDTQTQAWVAEASKWNANREYAAVVIPAPMSLGEAVRAQAFGAAFHAWVAATAIDLLPFLFLLIVLMLSREPLLRDEVTARPGPTIGTRETRIRQAEDAIVTQLRK